MTHTYQIQGMTCNGCVAKVKSELLKLGGITGAEVQLASPQATLTMEQHIGLPALQAAVSKAGNYTIEAIENASIDATPAATSSNSYFPILLIFGYITVVSLLAQINHPAFQWELWMRHFMAGFFLVFSFFKLLNLRGFATGYATYDILAKRIPAYGLIYPFIELGLGLAYITGFYPVLTNSITLIVMAISTVGVVQSLLRKTQFQCACLGTVIQLPLSKVTLAEDLLMLVMSATMLYLY